MAQIHGFDGPHRDFRPADGPSDPKKPQTPKTGANFQVANLQDRLLQLDDHPKPDYKQFDR